MEVEGFILIKTLIMQILVVKEQKIVWIILTIIIILASSKILIITATQCLEINNFNNNSNIKTIWWITTQIMKIVVILNLALDSLIQIATVNNSKNFIENLQLYLYYKINF